MQDEERKQNFDLAIRTYEAMICAYEALDYQLVEVPKISIKGRVKFILEQTANILPPLET